MTPTQAIRSSRGLKNITEVAEKVHGWNNQSRGTSVFAQQAVVITMKQIDELQARLRRLRGEDSRTRIRICQRAVRRYLRMILATV